MIETVYEVVSPIGKPAYQITPLAPRLSDLSGKTICELWDWLFRGEDLFPAIEEVLQQRYPGITFVNYKEFGNIHGAKDKELIESLPEMFRKHGCDVVISGVGA